ncbi:MAG: GTP-binding protein [Actinomycetota bacterium]|nr:GTP-binding protein [Actinomycetota bacterium]
MTFGPAQPTQVAAIRNVVLLGATGSGKTTLAEHLIASSGAITSAGSVDSGTSTLDHDSSARRQGRSVGLSIASLEYGDCLINLLDTPGFEDYLGEVRAGLRAADAALFVVSSMDGIDAATRNLWDECEAIKMPRAVVVTNLDNEESDFEETVAVCHRMFTGGRDVLPLHLPVLDDDGSFVGVLDLITNRIHEWSSAKRQERAADPEHLAMTADARKALMEGIAAESDDEVLMDLIIEGQEISAELLSSDLERAIVRGHFFPVQAFSGNNGVGAELILDLIVRSFPSPLERELPMVTNPQGEAIPPLTADPEGPLCAEVIKTTTDPQLGKISLVRVFSGRLPAEAPLHISGHFHNRGDRFDHDLTERDGQLWLSVGAIRTNVESAIAGSIVSVTQLNRAETGDTISYTTNPMLIEPWLMPEARLPIAISTAVVAHETHLAPALERLIAEDPTLRFELIDGQLVLWCLGEAHGELAVERMRERFAIEVVAEELKISLRETLLAPTRGHGASCDPSDEDGPMVACSIEMEPLDQGSGIEIVNGVDQEECPPHFRAAVERGVRQQMMQGALAGYPTTDVRIRITDVDLPVPHPSVHAFERAGCLAVVDAESNATKILLEPIDTLTITTPEEFVDAITKDLEIKRARVTQSDVAADGTVTLIAVVPAQELSRYAIDIRSLSHGAGTFTRESAGFARIPKKTGIQLLPLVD